MHVKELEQESEILATFDVLQHMYPDMEREEFEKTILQRIKENYRMVGIFNDDDKCICAAGFWIGVRFYCGKFIQLDNLATLPEYRSKGPGKMLVAWLKALAKRELCDKIILDTYVENFEAHRFFYREGFIIRGYHMNFSLDK